MRRVRVFEAFAGYGSTAISLKRLQRDFPEEVRFEFVGISEIEPYAIAAYNAVHGDTPNFGDISRIDWAQVPDFDLFTMSSPCQDFSSAGKQAGGEEGSGTRSSLLWECRKAILAKRPKYILFENVSAILSKKFKPGFLKWCAELESYGYANFYQLLNAKDYGIPQNRLRCFMVSILRTEADPNPAYNFPAPFPLKKRLRDVLEENVDESYHLKDEQVQRILAHTEKHKERGNGFSHKFEDGGGISGTILTAYGNRPTDTMLKVNEYENGKDAPRGQDSRQGRCVD